MWVLEFEVWNFRCEVSDSNLAWFGAVSRHVRDLVGALGLRAWGLGFTVEG